MRILLPFSSALRNFDAIYRGLPSFPPSYHNFSCAKLGSRILISLSRKFVGKPEISHSCHISTWDNWDFNATQTTGTLKFKLWFRHSRFIRISFGKIFQVFTRASFILKVNMSRQTLACPLTDGLSSPILKCSILVGRLSTPDVR